MADTFNVGGSFLNSLTNMGGELIQQGTNMVKSQAVNTLTGSLTTMLPEAVREIADPMLKDLANDALGIQQPQGKNQPKQEANIGSVVSVLGQMNNKIEVLNNRVDIGFKTVVTRLESLYKVNVEIRDILKTAHAPALKQDEKKKSSDVLNIRLLEVFSSQLAKTFASQKVLGYDPGSLQAMNLAVARLTQAIPAVSNLFGAQAIKAQLKERQGIFSVTIQKQLEGLEWQFMSLKNAIIKTGNKLVQQQKDYHLYNTEKFLPSMNKMLSDSFKNYLDKNQSNTVFILNKAFNNLNVTLNNIVTALNNGFRMIADSTRAIKTAMFNINSNKNVADNERLNIQVGGFDSVIEAIKTISPNLTRSIDIAIHRLFAMWHKATYDVEPNMYKMWKARDKFSYHYVPSKPHASAYKYTPEQTPSGYKVNTSNYPNLNTPPAGGFQPTYQSVRYNRYDDMKIDQDNRIKNTPSLFNFVGGKFDITSLFGTSDKNNGPLPKMVEKINEISTAVLSWGIPGYKDRLKEMEKDDQYKQQMFELSEDTLDSIISIKGAVSTFALYALNPKKFLGKLLYGMAGFSLFRIFFKEDIAKFWSGLKGFFTPMGDMFQTTMEPILSGINNIGSWINKFAEKYLPESIYNPLKTIASKISEVTRVLYHSIFPSSPEGKAYAKMKRLEWINTISSSLKATVVPVLYNILASMAFMRTGIGLLTGQRGGLLNFAGTAQAGLGMAGKTAMLPIKGISALLPKGQGPAGKIVGGTLGALTKAAALIGPAILPMLGAFVILPFLVKGGEVFVKYIQSAIGYIMSRRSGEGGGLFNKEKILEIADKIYSMVGSLLASVASLIARNIKPFLSTVWALTKKTFTVLAKSLISVIEYGWNWMVNTVKNWFTDKEKQTTLIQTESYIRAELIAAQQRELEIKEKLQVLEGKQYELDLERQKLMEQDNSILGQTQRAASGISAEEGFVGKMNKIGEWIKSMYESSKEQINSVIEGASGFTNSLVGGMQKGVAAFLRGFLGNDKSVEVLDRAAASAQAKADAASAAGNESGVKRWTSVANFFRGASSHNTGVISLMESNLQAQKKLMEYDAESAIRFGEAVNTFEESVKILKAQQDGLLRELREIGIIQAKKKTELEARKKADEGGFDVKTKEDFLNLQQLQDKGLDKITDPNVQKLIFERLKETGEVKGEGATLITGGNVTHMLLLQNAFKIIQHEYSNDPSIIGRIQQMLLYDYIKNPDILKNSSSLMAAIKGYYSRISVRRRTELGLVTPQNSSAINDIRNYKPPEGESTTSKLAQNLSFKSRYDKYAANQLSKTQQALSMVTNPKAALEGMLKQYDEKAYNSSKITNMFDQVAQPKLLHEFNKPYKDADGTEKFHQGIDIAAPFGSGFKPLYGGTYSDFGYRDDLGYYAKIKHENGYESIYAHLSGYPNLLLDSPIDTASKIFNVGKSGNATYPHLHLAMTKNGIYVDPFSYTPTVANKTDYSDIEGAPLSTPTYARETTPEVLENVARQVQAGDKPAQMPNVTDISALGSGDGLMSMLLPEASRIRLSSPFGMRTHPIKGTQKLHKGIDLAAPTGTIIRSPVDGKVIISKNNPGGYGNYVVIDSGKVQTLYAHMHKPSHLRPGQTVKLGDPVGLLGSSGGSTGPHLHFETRPSGAPFFKSHPRDPFSYFSKAPKIEVQEDLNNAGGWFDDVFSGAGNLLGQVSSPLGQMTGRANNFLDQINGMTGGRLSPVIDPMKSTVNRVGDIPAQMSQHIRDLTMRCSELEMQIQELAYSKSNEKSGEIIGGKIDKFGKSIKDTKIDKSNKAPNIVQIIAPQTSNTSNVATDASSSNMSQSNGGGGGGNPLSYLIGLL